MSPTRNNIIQTAQRLFLERGYENVSLRDISSECGISHGNLTYHFRTKEDLVVAVMGEVFDEIYDEFALSTDHTLEELLGHLHGLAEENRNYLFYFRNMLSLAGSFPVLKERQQRFREQNFYFYIRTFKELVAAGQMRGDIPDVIYEGLAMRMIMVQVEWSLKDSPSDDAVFRQFDLFSALATALYPYLTDEGRAIWDESCNG